MTQVVVRAGVPNAAAPPTTVARGRLGDRLAAFAVCLPAEPRGVVLVATPAPVAESLRRWFPGAVEYDAQSLPPAGTVGLLIVDETEVAPEGTEELLATVAVDGVVATLGRRGDHAVYPSVLHPQHIWRRGWPVPEVTGARARVRRTAGLWGAARRGVPHLSTTGAGFESLADLVVADLGATLRDRFRLVGVQTAGHTVLRCRGDRLGEVAVRLSGTERDADLTVSDRVAADVPAVAHLVPPALARGCSAGRPWTATPWVPQRRVGLVGAWRAGRRTDAVVAELTDALASARLGRTGPGWAEDWVGRVELVPLGVAARLAGLLTRLENGLPTGWCHGDPWSGNVLVEGGRATVIDWDNASRDAPLGIDRLLVAAVALAGARGTTVAQACTSLVDTTEDVGEVAGARWADWDRAGRAALLVATWLLYLRNRSSHDLGSDMLTAELAGLLDLVAIAAEVEVAADDEAGPGSSHPTAVGGAGWLGLGAGVVKGAQTVVLLLLAALLSPSHIGVLAIGALVLNVTSAITDLGSSTALVYWRGDAERAARSALTLALSLALALTGAVWLLAPSLAAALNAGDIGTDVIRGLIWCLPLSAVAGVSQELLRRALSFKRRVLPDIVGALTGAVVSVSLAVAGQGAWSLVIGQLVQATLVMLLCWSMRPPVRPGWRRRDVVGLVSYGGSLAGANILQLLMLNVDYLLVARYLGTQPLGVYSMAFRLAYMPYLLVAVVMGGAAFAHLCRLRGTDVGRALVEVTATMFMVVLPLYLGMALLAPQLQLLGTKWSDGVPALRWLAAYGLVLSLVNLCLVALNSVSRTRDTFLLNLLHLVLLTGLLAWWTGRGIEMVAVAQVVAGGAMLLAALALVRRRVEGIALRQVARRLVSALVGGTTMTLALLALRQLMPWTRVSVSGLLLAGSLALAAYAVPLLLLDRRELHPIADVRRGAP